MGFGFGFLRGRLVLVLVVVVSAVVSFVCCFYCFALEQPHGMIVSVDWPVYCTWISHMRSVHINPALWFAFSNDRAVLVLCYALSFVFPIVSVVQFAPAVLLVV